MTAHQLSTDRLSRKKWSYLERGLKSEIVRGALAGREAPEPCRLNPAKSSIPLRVITGLAMCYELLRNVGLSFRSVLDYVSSESGLRQGAETFRCHVSPRKVANSGRCRCR